MNHDYLLTRDRAAHVAGTSTLILLCSDGGARVEITEQNQELLEREMAGMLEDPLQALMAEVALEFRQMARASSAGEPLRA